jgi:uncharacterized delta-60 repeat protein
MKTNGDVSSCVRERLFKGADRSKQRFCMLMKAATLIMLLLLMPEKGRGQSAADGFDPGADRNVKALAVQSDGKILVGGTFSTLGGGGSGTNTRKRIGRLNRDGVIDLTFNPGANDIVDALAVQPDGKIVAGGFFTTFGGGGTGTTVRNHIARANADGTLDTPFDPGANGEVLTLAMQTDGKIVVGGNFTTLGGGGTIPRNFIARLNADGTLDTSFDPGANAQVIALSIQADGKILMGGSFTTLGGGGTGTVVRNRIARLNPDGSLDTTFDPGANNNVQALAVQADGKILAGGDFTMFGGGGTGTVARNRVARVNSDGTLDSLDPGANDHVKSLVVQPNGKILVGGDFTKLGGGGSGVTLRNHLGRLNSDGALDAGFDPGANSTAVITLVLQADGKIVVGGTFTTLGGGGTGTTPRNFVGRLYADGSLDTNFDPGANGSVRAVAAQTDGKILFGGDFTTIGGGGTGTVPRNRIARINPDGTLDTAFDPGANGEINALLVQPDGKILVAGNFTMLGGGGTGTTLRNHLGRLNADGTLDTTFTHGGNRAVLALALQVDGKILIGGDFTKLTGSPSTPRTHIARLNSDSTADTSFDPGANRTVRSFAVQANGAILVGGDFTTLGGGGTGTTTRKRIGRLNSDGTLDTSFNPGAGKPVRALWVQVDGEILVGGDFTTLGGGGTTPRNFIGRINPDGTLDTGFDPGANFSVLGLALQTDGKILVAGSFTTLGGGGTGNTARNFIGRLNSDGTLDVNFNPGANAAVRGLALETDGKIVVGGDFTTLGGGGTGTTPRNFIGRLSSPDPAGEVLSVDATGTSVSWFRAGALPEVASVTFELSTDGTNYSALANPTRVTGGWQLTGQTLPTQQNIFVRARGFYSTGESDGSGSIAESIRNAFLPPP